MRTRTVATLVVVIALGLRMAYWAEIRDSPLDRWHEWNQTDMATYLEQARQIADEDFLATTPHHPYHNWQARWPAERWIAWYGPHAFHQAPAYAYLLAGARRLIDDPLPWVKGLQLVLGAGSCVLTLLLARRLDGPLAGWVAGLLAAVYGPLLYLEPQVLREGPGLFCVLAILLLLVGHLGADPASSRVAVVRCTGLGLLLGLFATFHEIGIVVFGVVSLALGVFHLRSDPRRKRAGFALAALLVGALGGFAPLLARNLAVGAPPFSVSCRTRINFVEANVAQAENGGATFSLPSASVGQILDRAEGSFLRAALGVLDSYDGDLGRMLRNWMIRFAAIWQPLEAADNTSYLFHREMTRSLAYLPTFRGLFPIGFAGALILFAGPFVPALRRERSAGHLALLFYLVALAIAFSFNHTVGRYRLFLVPFFWVYGGVFAAMLVRSVTRRRFVGTAALLAAMLLGTALQHVAATPFKGVAVRPADFGMGCELALARGDFAFAIAAAEKALRYFPDQAIFFATIARQYEKIGEQVLALEFYQRALRVDPAYPPAQRGLARSQVSR